MGHAVCISRRALAGLGVASLVAGSLAAANPAPAGATGSAVVSVGSASVWEGHSKTRIAAVPVTLSEPLTTPVVVTYTVSAGTATPGLASHAASGADFKAASGTLTFPAEAVSKFINVHVYGDTREEGDETVHVDVTSVTGATAGDTSGLVTIRDDDSGATPGTVLSVGDASTTEGNSKTRTVKFTMSLSQPATGDVTAHYHLAGQTATGAWSGGGKVPNNADFADKLGVEQSVLFKANAKHVTPVQKLIAVKTVADTHGEADETFAIVVDSITAPAGVTVDDGTGVGTIVNDDQNFLTVRVAASNGSGHVTSSPPGIDCPGTCTAFFDYGTVVSLTAAPDAGSSFSWTAPGGCAATDNPCVVTLTDDFAPLVTFASTSTSWSAVSAGQDHTCGIYATAAYCWGLGADGEMGNGTTTTTNSAPVAVSGLGSGVAEISAGWFHTCARTTSGAAKCWGFGTDGELGNGASSNSSTPVTVSGLGSDVADVSAGGAHSCAVTTGGAAYCWGDNAYGQLGDGSTTPSSTPVAVSGLGSGVVQIDAGLTHTCAAHVGRCGLLLGFERGRPAGRRHEHREPCSRRGVGSEFRCQAGLRRRQHWRPTLVRGHHRWRVCSAGARTPPASSATAPRTTATCRSRSAVSVRVSIKPTWAVATSRTEATRVRSARPERSPAGETTATASSATARTLWRRHRSV